MADNTRLARDYFECWNRRDWKAYRDRLSPQYSYTGPDGKRQDGPDAGVAVGQMFATGFPDGKINLTQVIAAGDNSVVAEFLGTGTHKGEIMGLAPTGRKVSVPICEVLEFRDGKIIAEHEYFDMLTMLQQLGLAPAQPAATKA